MSEILRIFVDGRPESKGSWRCLCHGRKPRLIPDNEGEDSWSTVVAWSARAKLRGYQPTKKRYSVILHFTLPPRDGRKSNKRDLDKLMRSCLDSLTGIVWIDDEQVDDARLSKRIGDTPGVEIIVEEML